MSEIHKLYKKDLTTKLIKYNGIILVASLIINVVINLVLKKLETITLPEDHSKVNFLKYSKALSNITIFIFFPIISFFQFFNKEKYYFSIAVAINLMIDIPILITSGILRSYYVYKGDFLIFILAFEILIRSFLSLGIYQKYKITMIFTIIIALYNIVLLYFVHKKIPSSVLDYIITKLVFLFFLNFFSYTLEKSRLSELTYNYKLKEEKKYYFNILESMNTGLFFIKNSNIYYNQVIKDIYTEHKRNNDYKNTANTERSLDKSNESLSTETILKNLNGNNQLIFKIM